jgi:hypothetical protein
MRHRYLGLFSALGVVVAAITLSLTAVAAEPQGKTQLASKGPRIATTPTVPRTADGHPDLQGVWNFATITPLERPAGSAGKQVLTDEEAATLEKQAAQNRVDRPPRAGDPGGYNQFWTDSGTTVARTKQTSLIVDPPDGKFPPLTAEGQRRGVAEAETLRRLATGPEDRHLAERCILGFNAGPPMISGPYNNNVQLFQTHEYVIILNEMNHDARIVPIDGRPHRTLRQWMGDSRGHWEGETLVIDSINFRNEGTGRLPRLLSPAFDENLHLIERFTRTDADMLLYEFTVNDPTMWTKPWTARIPMTKTNDHIYEFACHEGNYGLFGILKGARADQKAAEAAAKKGSR